MPNRAYLKSTLKLAKRLPFALLLAASISTMACRSKVARVDGGADASAILPVACTSIVTVAPSIGGSYVGGGDDEQARDPALIVATDEYRAPNDKIVVSVALAPPFFARDFSAEDLCVDDGSTDASIRVACLQLDHGAVASRHVTVRFEGESLVASGDGVSAEWTRPFALTTAPACVRLQGFGKRGDLGPLAATWGVDHPSARCASSPGSGSSIDAVLDFPRPNKSDKNFIACGSGVSGAERWLSGVNQTEVFLRIPAAHVNKNLGWLSNQCGGFEVTRFADVNAVGVLSSDMGTASRLVYQLGDRVYFTQDERTIASVEIPCGTRARFVVRNPLQTPVVETEKMREER